MLSWNPKVIIFSLSLTMQLFVKTTNWCPATSFGLDSFILWNTRIRIYWVLYYWNITCCQLVHMYVVSMCCISYLLSCLWTCVDEDFMKCSIAIDSFHIGKHMLWIEWDHIHWQSSGYFMYSRYLAFHHFIWGVSCIAMSGSNASKWPKSTLSMCHSGARTIWVVFLALQTWNSYFCFRGPVAMCELSLGVPTRSSRRPHGEPLRGTVLTPSSSTKVAAHIWARGCIQSGESQHRPYNPTGSQP